MKAIVRQGLIAPAIVIIVAAIAWAAAGSTAALIVMTIGAAAIIDIVSAENPPVHLFIGSDAFRLANEKRDAMGKELENWKVLSIGTDF